MINRILVSADLLRVRANKDGKLDYFHRIRLDRHWNFLQYPLSLAVGVPVALFSPRNTDFDFFEFYKLCGLKLENELDWYEIYDMKNVPDAAVEYYNKYINNSLVIYHEIPHIYRTIHAKLNIPYIDMNVHPVRFLDDNFWGMKTNSKQIFDRLKTVQVDEEVFYIYAGMHRANFAQAPLGIAQNSALFAGQTNIDKSLYSNGKFLSIFDFKDKIMDLGEKYDRVYYKPHPYNRDLSKILEFLGQFPFVETINENIYKILSSDYLSNICALTSGSLYEAKYFGKESEFLAPPYLHFDYSKDCTFGEDTTLSIYDEFMYPHFWAEVLQNIVPVNKCKKILLPQRANRIRAAFNDYWSATELDPAFKLIDRQYQPIFRRIEHSSNLMKKAIENSKVNENSKSKNEKNSRLLPRWFGLIISCFIPKKKNRERFIEKYIKK